MLIRAVILVGAFDAVDVGDEFALRIAELLAGVAEIKVEAAIGAEVEGVDAVVVLRTADLREQELFAVGFVVAVVVDEPENVVAAGDEGFVAEDADAVGAVHIAALVEDGGFVGLGVAVGVFEDEDAVALGAFAVVLAVVHDLAHPHAAPVVDVDAGRRSHHWLAGEELHGELGMHVELLGGFRRLVRGSCDGAGLQRAGILRVNAELDAGARALLRATFIESAACFEALRAFGKIESDDAIRMRADAVFNGLARAAKFFASDIGIDAHISETGLR